MKLAPVIAVAALAAVLFGVAAPAEARTVAAPPKPDLVVAVAGDSTTAFANSWRAQVRAVDKKISFTGFAKPGYTSAQVLANIPAAPADILVIKVGTNDFKTTADIAPTVENIKGIAAKVSAPRVILSAIVPSNVTKYGALKINRQVAGAQLNAALKELAAANGWEFIDPDKKFRTASNRFKYGYTHDGVHPSTKGYKAEAALFLALFRA